MMALLYARGALILCLTLGLLIGLLSAIPPVDPAYYDDLKTFLLSPLCSGSTAPCWMGVRLGQTTLHDAEAMLRAHPWVREVRFLESTYALDVSWREGGRGFLPKNLAAPAHIRFSTDDQTAFSIALRVNIPTADFWMLAGRPEYLYAQAPVLVWTPTRTPSAGTVLPTPIPQQSIVNATHTGYYPWLRAFATMSSPCALDALEFWDGAVVELYYGSRLQQMPYEGYIDWGETLNMQHCTPQYAST